VDTQGHIIDEVTLVEMPEGQSYSGQRQAEIFCHGGQYVLKRILAEIFNHGPRPAEPGEFTRRAFLAGRIDLARAEAVADLIASKTEFSYNSAKNNLIGKLSGQIEMIRNRVIELLAEIEANIDHPEEDIESSDQNIMTNELSQIINEIGELADSYRSGRIIREGFKIAIAGRPNAGKSSLFNLLLNQNRAIVAPIPGTTRDYLTEWIDLDGIAVSITDTAGLRKSNGIIERAGQKSATDIMNNSDLILWMVDITRGSWKRDLKKDLTKIPNRVKILLFNKIDKCEKINLLNIGRIDDGLEGVKFSCVTKAGFRELRKEMISHINCQMPDLTDALVITSERHKKKFNNALKYLKRAIAGFKRNDTPELISFEIRLGINEIDEITGRVYNEDILDSIFSRFCIGK